jgi:hypothetical protein
MHPRTEVLKAITKDRVRRLQAEAASLARKARKR